MYKKTLAAIFITSCILVNPLFASNIFQKFMPPHPTKKASEALKSDPELKKNFTNFSGTWVGTCTGSDEPYTLTIENSDSEFTINGKDYEIGSLETEASSSEDGTFIFHTVCKWSADSSLLINSSYIIYDLASENREHFFGYVNGTISLKNEQLTFEVDQHSSKSNVNTVCTYQKQ